MRKLLILIAALGGTAAQATTAQSALELWQADRTRIFSAAEVDLNDFQWQARPVVVLADSPADPRFVEQMERLLQRPEALDARDVVLITDTAPAESSDIRKKLRPRGFMLVLIGKDGGVKLRKPLPWSVRELSRVIDKIPTRQQEIRDRRAQ